MAGLASASLLAAARERGMSGDGGQLTKVFQRRESVQAEKKSPSSSSTPMYAAVENALTSSKTAFAESITQLDEALKALLPPDMPIFRGQTRHAENAPPIAVKLALRDLRSAQEQFECEDSVAALHAAATLRERADKEAANARHNAERATDAASERARAIDLEERLRLADNSVDLLRNAIARRDNLLAEQRAAYFRDLLQYKADKQAAALNAPAATYEKALEGVPVEERPAFFDACVFEAVHLACDTPMADKAKRALEQASAKQMEAQGSAAVEVGRMKQLLESERRKQREVNAQYEARGQQVEADVAKAVLAGIADATEEMTRRHQEDIDRAWERIRELEQEVRATWSR